MSVGVIRGLSHQTLTNVTNIYSICICGFKFSPFSPPSLLPLPPSFLPLPPYLPPPSPSSPGGALQRLLGAVTEARKLEVENGHQWKQTKNLLKYIKNQERESVKTER